MRSRFNGDPRGAERELQAEMGRMNEKFGPPANAPVIPVDRSFGPFRQWWADRPVLTVLTMYATPVIVAVVLLLLF